jgi:hypothetical protein
MSCHRAVGVRSFRLPRRGQPACPLAELQSAFLSSEFHRNAFVKRLGILQILAAMSGLRAWMGLDDQKRERVLRSAYWERPRGPVNEERAPIVPEVNMECGVSNRTSANRATRPLGGTVSCLRLRR